MRTFWRNAKKCAQMRKCELYVRIMFACAHYVRILAKCETVLALDVEKVNLK